MSSLILGCDPGKSGGWAILGGPAPVVGVAPLAGKDLDLGALAAAWRGVSYAVVEKVGAMPGQGVVSMFSFGRSFGSVLGVLAGLGVPVELVTPQRWKGVVLDGSAKDKDAAIAWCRRVHPGVNLLPSERARVPHDGIADALCIAEYGRRTYL